MALGAMVTALAMLASVQIGDAATRLGAPSEPLVWQASASTSQQVGKLVNQLRTTNGRNSLRPSERLEKVAAIHAQDMARRGYFSHRSPEGARVFERLRATGYSYCWAGENIARGQRDSAAVVQAWINSWGHKRLMLHRMPTEYGLARAPNNTWVLVLARPGC
ncbi:uncharacterized protein YkwD [Aliiruegeria haliotis]|uniref:Uncharacterized protein YkwD n=1 Tax=Aliiruegeria haliotis TaxID=1280846 RepID=A0A2T0RR06_9RHOB|nr:CAP domain-containing protein [Aliiruegeria haliotis]PRY23591.1 uncharacterized protein YkwD [Aliiruegeria haliotis]